MKIGVFDSGLGGLSVLHTARKLLPDADFIYYADEEHVPYGEKQPEIVKTYIREILKFMLEEQVDAIVIACNTATSLVGKEYRENFPVPIIGMEPAVKRAIDLYGTENKRILVAATPITINGNKLHTLVEQVDQSHLSDLIALPGLVRFAEQGDYDSEEVIRYLKKELSKYSLEEFGTVVLGCTHFNYFKESFSKVFPNPIHFVDGNEGTIHQVMRLLNITNMDSLTNCTKGKSAYYISGKSASTAELEIIKKHLEQLERM